MKITFVGPNPNLSGGARVIATYADALQARGHDVCVIAPKEVPPTKMDWLRALKHGRLPMRAAKQTHYDSMNARLISLDHSGPVSNEDVPDADVVIATWWETAFSVAQFLPEKGKKYYFVQHHEVHDFLPKHISAGSYYLPLRKIAVSDWLKRIMQDQYGDCDVTVVPNSVDFSLFHAERRGKQTSPTIGLMYTSDPSKGLDVSLAAIQLVQKAYPDLQVVAFGEYPVQNAMPLPAGATYFRRPPQDQLREIYAQCDVFIAGSYTEGFGLPILEALSCRCPVVATRTGCASDIIRDGENGFVVDVGDSAAMADRVCDTLKLANDEWVQMSETAGKSAHQYSWEDATTLFEKTISENKDSRL